MITFAEFTMIKKIQRDLNEGVFDRIKDYSKDFIKRLSIESLVSLAKEIAIRYGLTSAIVLSILSGGPCNKKECPTPQVQQQVKQEFEKVVAQQTDSKQELEKTHQLIPPEMQNTSEIKKVGPDTYEITGIGNNTQVAEMDAKQKLSKHLGIRNIEVHSQMLSKRTSGKIIVAKFRITVQ